MRNKIAIISSFLFGACGMLLVTIFSRSEYFLVRILDHNKCSDPSYSLLMDGYHVEVSTSQIETNPLVAREAEAFIHVRPPYDGKSKYLYRIIAEYSDCEKVESKQREVERGVVMYEWIENGSIRQQIRGIY